jgi:hypothetical protein
MCFLIILFGIAVAKISETTGIKTSQNFNITFRVFSGKCTSTVLLGDWSFLFLFCIFNIFLQTLYHGATQAMLQCFNLLQHDLNFFFFFHHNHGTPLIWARLWVISSVPSQYIFFLIIIITESRWLWARRFKLSRQYLYNFFLFFFLVTSIMERRWLWATL